MDRHAGISRGYFRLIAVIVAGGFIGGIAVALSLATLPMLFSGRATEALIAVPLVLLAGGALGLLVGVSAGIPVGLVRLAVKRVGGTLVTTTLVAASGGLGAWLCTYLLVAPLFQLHREGVSVVVGIAAFVAISLLLIGTESQRGRHNV